MSACPNCGNKGWSEKKDAQCENCGMKNIETKELSPSILMFCTICACHFMAPPGCPVHPEDQQHPAKF